MTITVYSVRLISKLKSTHNSWVADFADPDLAQEYAEEWSDSYRDGYLTVTEEEREI